MLTRDESLKLGIQERDHWPLPWSCTAGDTHAPLELCKEIKSCKETDKGV